MTRKVWWGLAAAALALTGLLVSPQAFLVTLVAAAVFAGLVVISRPAKARSGERHLVFTMGTAVAFGLIWLAFPTQSYVSPPLGAFLCGAVAMVGLVDLVVAVAVTGRVTTTLEVERTEMVVGDTGPLTVHVDGPPLPVTLQLGPAVRRAADPATRASTAIHAQSRRVVSDLPVEVRSTGLCGVFGFRRRSEVPLSTPLYVGPRPLDPGRPFPPLDGTWGEGGHLPSPTGDVVRGVRDYVPGDRRSLVHWRATARTGRLVVKEVEEPFAPVLLLVLDLGAGGPAGEEAAGRAAWYVNEARRRGVEVVLATREASGLNTGPVDASPEAIRRLASAVAGPPTPVPGQASAPAPLPPWITSPGSATGPAPDPARPGEDPAAGPPSSPGTGPAATPLRHVLRVGPEGDRWG